MDVPDGADVCEAAACPACWSIDSYDSFVYNLVQYLGELGADPVVVRNDELTVDEALALGARRRAAVAWARPSGGRRDPHRRDPGLRRARCARARCVPRPPGHRPRVRRRRRVGARADARQDQSSWSTTGAGVLAGLPEPFEATRYHSLVIERDSMPDVLEITAETVDGIVMARAPSRPARARACSSTPRASSASAATTCCATSSTSPSPPDRPGRRPSGRRRRRGRGGARGRGGGRRRRGRGGGRWQRRRGRRRGGRGAGLVDDQRDGGALRHLLPASRVLATAPGLRSACRTRPPRR